MSCNHGDQKFTLATQLSFHVSRPQVAATRDIRQHNSENASCSVTCTTLAGGIQARSRKPTAIALAARHLTAGG
jgi:hypothetical protein